MPRITVLSFWHWVYVRVFFLLVIRILFVFPVKWDRKSRIPFWWSRIERARKCFACQLFKRNSVHTKNELEETMRCAIFCVSPHHTYHSNGWLIASNFMNIGRFTWSNCCQRILSADSHDIIVLCCIQRFSLER